VAEVTGSPPGGGAVLVVGLGHPDRGDDAVGPLVAQASRAFAPPGVRVVLTPEPLGLPEVWEGADTVVVVDAAVGPAPGAVQVHDLSGGSDPPAPVALSATSSHGLPLLSVVALARTTGRVPRDLRLVTVAGASFGLGDRPSQAVLDAVPAAALEVVRQLRPTQPTANGR
jgi:hydrogenase maturation protease